MMIDYSKYYHLLYLKFKERVLKHYRAPLRFEVSDLNKVVIYDIIYINKGMVNGPYTCQYRCFRESSSSRTGTSTSGIGDFVFHVTKGASRSELTVPMETYGKEWCLFCGFPKHVPGYVYK